MGSIPKLSHQRIPVKCWTKALPPCAHHSQLTPRWSTSDSQQGAGPGRTRVHPSGLASFSSQKSSPSGSIPAAPLWNEPWCSSSPFHTHLLCWERGVPGATRAWWHGDLQGAGSSLLPLSPPCRMPYLLHSENLLSPSGGARWTHCMELSVESICTCSMEEQWFSKLSCELQVTRQMWQ